MIRLEVLPATKSRKRTELFCKNKNNIAAPPPISTVWAAAGHVFLSPKMDHTIASAARGYK
jgi:hypothetical protein